MLTKQTLTTVAMLLHELRKTEDVIEWNASYTRAIQKVEDEIKLVNKKTNDDYRGKQQNLDKKKLKNKHLDAMIISAIFCPYFIALYNWVQSVISEL